ncbi:MAG: NYN domain-containing protein [Thermoanaerobaculia bacterium]|nr:NYN domain-containing protein [Thermoanaerobaculia bacterium]
MSPWWLRPTAESEHQEPTDVPAAASPARPERPPAEPPPAQVAPPPVMPPPVVPPPAELETVAPEPEPPPPQPPSRTPRPWYLVDPSAAPEAPEPPPAKVEKLAAIEPEPPAPLPPRFELGAIFEPEIAPVEEPAVPYERPAPLVELAPEPVFVLAEPEEESEEESVTGADEPALAEAVAGGEPRPGRSRGRRGRRSGRGGSDDRAAAEPAADPSAAPTVASLETDEPRARRSERPAARPEGKVERRGGPGTGGTAHSITTDEISAMREMVFTVPTFAPPPARVTEERKIAMFCDLENVALGVRDSEIKKFDINLILERLLEKGKIIVKKAYADWERYSDYKRPFHEAGIELLDIPQKYYSGKNSADIKMVVDAMDVCYAKDHLDTFVIVSGDSDFTPLVSKLKENDKHVIGIGVKNSTSNLLIDNCDEFIYYEDIWRDQQAGPDLAGLSSKSAEVFGLMIDAIQALIRENKDVLWGSMIKQTMQRKKPSFNEGYFGYTSFSELLEDAERKGILKLKKDQRSGTYIVTGFAKR